MILSREQEDWYNSMGIITDIKRFEINDGDGIRTTVFLKGCSLKCLWCHNPEGILSDLQLSYNKYKCINCGECAVVCEAHSIVGGRHIFDRNRCTGLGRCEPVCLGNALKFYGRETSVDDLVQYLLEDKPFFDESSGGVTLSGGEPLMQPDFCVELLRRLKGYNINTIVDTCAFVDPEAFKKVMEYTDMFLIDVKAIDEQTHIRCTGQSNRQILDNIYYVDTFGKPFDVRIPFVPEMNDNEMESIGKFLSTLKMLRSVRVLPYHNMAVSKYESLNMDYQLPDIKIPTEIQVTNAINSLKFYGLNVEDFSEWRDEVKNRSA